MVRNRCQPLAFEYEHARLEGVKFLWHAQPRSILGSDAVQEIELISLADSAEFKLPLDLLVLAIGQGSQTSLSDKIQVERGRILIDRATGQTSNPKVFAGGDCTNGGREVVDAVADGKRAGIGIAAWLEPKLVTA